MRISQATKNDIKSRKINISGNSFQIYWLMTDKADNYETWFTMQHDEIISFSDIRSKNTIMHCISELETAGLIERRKVSHKTVEYRVIK